MLRKLLLVSMMVVAITVGCGAQEPETTTYTNSEFGYSITLIDPYTDVEELNEKAEVRIGVSEGGKVQTVVHLMVIEGEEPFGSDELDASMERLSEISEKRFPDLEVEFKIVSTSDLKLGSGQTARIQLQSLTVPDDCERHEYTLNVIHEGRLFHLMGMPCGDGSEIEVIKTIINSFSLSH